MGREKTGRPLDIPIGSHPPRQDFERRRPIVPPGAATYIYSGEFRQTAKTASFTLSNEMVVLVDASGGDIILTLPAAANNAHKVYTIKKVDSSPHSVTIKGADSDETIDGEESIEISFQYQYVTIICDGSEWFIIGGEYVKMEKLLEQILNILEQIRDSNKDVVTHLELGSDEELEGGD